MLACCFFYTGFTAPGSLSEYKTSKEFQVCNSFKFTLFNLQGTMFASHQGSLFSIPSIHAFVKNFSILFKHFSMCCDDFLISNLISLTQLFQLVKKNFHFLFCFHCCDRWSLSSNLVSLSYPIHPVKNFFLPVSSFFQSFGFFMMPFSQAPD